MLSSKIINYKKNRTAIIVIFLGNSSVQEIKIQRCSIKERELYYLIKTINTTYYHYSNVYYCLTVINLIDIISKHQKSV